MSLGALSCTDPVQPALLSFECHTPFEYPAVGQSMTIVCQSSWARAIVPMPEPEIATSNPAVITIDGPSEYGKVPVTAVGVGSAIFTATLRGKTVSMPLTVVATGGPSVSAELEDPVFVPGESHCLSSAFVVHPVDGNGAARPSTGLYDAEFTFPASTAVVRKATADCGAEAPGYAPVIVAVAAGTAHLMVKYGGVSGDAPVTVVDTVAADER